MNEISALWQSTPWLVLGVALVAVNLVLFALKITKRLLLLAVGAALIALGVYFGVIEVPAGVAGLASLG